MKKKKLILIILAAVIAIFLVVMVIVWVKVFSLPKPQPEDIETDIIDAESDLALIEQLNVSLIDGTEIENPKEQMISVIIENHGDSRKQMAGLYDASLVFETEAEGGITRFLAFYPYQNTEKVGPVRSVRPYFVRWAEQFDTGFAHAGGSDLGLNAIYNSGRVFDLEGLALEGLAPEDGDKYFERDYLYYAPHNLFANIGELRDLLADKSWNKTLTDEFVKFGELPEDEIPYIETALIIHIYYPFPQYFVRYDYNEKDNLYYRYQGGERHMDHANNRQITASNVVILLTDYYPYDDEGRLYMRTEGSGDMFLFRDGYVIPGRWHKTDNQSALRFYDELGKELVFSPGKTWISVVNYPEGLQWE